MDSDGASPGQLSPAELFAWRAFRVASQRVAREVKADYRQAGWHIPRDSLSTLPPTVKLRCPKCSRVVDVLRPGLDFYRDEMTPGCAHHDPETGISRRATHAWVLLGHDGGTAHRVQYPCPGNESTKRNGRPACTATFRVTFDWLWEATTSAIKRGDTSVDLP